ncbi:MAG: EscU/YscU/HrcU family type III secretion system export apparatus switch protein [Desulfobulbaceae bacterium]|nr:EscU/YscU/HrcU family type III secretion system export apparatus switch protein [Desulfobulbaceae bacterium]MCK5438009.1 EscU/YscU/HrcU family type III secretion system export apparatus switch protein [Desulfobulbaceae bacterium]
MTEKSDSGKKPPRKKAVALRYDREKEPAPIVVGKGIGLLAEKLIELAKEHEIPIHEDADLIEILSRLDLKEEIPAATYLVVAEILAFIYRTNESYG